MRNTGLAEEIRCFRAYLQREERTESTIHKYVHDVEQFFIWMEEKPLTKEMVTAWKAYLCSLGRATVTINSALPPCIAISPSAGFTDAG